MRACVRTAFLPFTEAHEGPSPDYFHCDVKGLVTIGPGLLADPAIPPGLDFVRVGRNVPASPAQIRMSWNAVKAEQASRLAGGAHYAKLPGNVVRATRASIERQTWATLGAFEAELKATFPELEGWPADAQLGLIGGMAWAYGSKFARTGWPKFRAACQRRDWLAAAAECRPSAVELAKQNASFRDRVAATVTMFTNAALGALPEELYYPRDLQAESAAA